MNAYVLGAGASKSVGYPMGAELLDEIDKYIRQSGNLVHRYGRKDWDCMHRWLEKSPNPSVTRAYHAKNIEHLFTVLDLAIKQRDDEINRRLAGQGFSSDSPLKEHRKYRDMLLWFLERYFAWRHDADRDRSNGYAWDALRALGNRLKAGDVVITFNYDATLERVLLHLGKWSPRDGYGFELTFRETDDDRTPVAFDRSPIRVLHLHGATGWYRSPPSSPLKHEGTPSEELGAAPTTANISLDPRFLQGLGIRCVDASVPATSLVAREEQIILHPSFLKQYTDDHVFAEIWRQAAEGLRGAEHTYIIGYSLPWADAAAFTLFLTSLRRQAVTVVNRKKCDLGRFRLFSDNLLPLTLEQWLAQ